MSEEAVEVTGACLCGKVTYQAPIVRAVGACHCQMCRSWGAGPYMSVRAVGTVSFSGSENIGIYSSSKWAERGFCKQCGSNLYYRLLPRTELPKGIFMLSVGTVADQSCLQFVHEVFVENAPSWYRFAGAEERHCMTEAEALAAFS